MAETVDDFIFTVRSRGDYTFTLQEILTQVLVSKEAITLALNRAVRKGFYVIIPPVTYFLDDLMRWLGRSYYMGLYCSTPGEIATVDR
jgi:hypothetical protein